MAGNATSERRVIVIAGPNGAGKTTFAGTFLPHEGGCLNFVNADLIAGGLAPFHPESAAVAAGKLMLTMIHRFVASGDSFAMETTLSGRGWRHQMQAWQHAGYEISLLFLKLRSEELALSRVRSRVAQGGHFIADDVVRRRFRQGWHNFQTIYRPLVDHWELYDNSGCTPVLIDQGIRR